MIDELFKNGRLRGSSRVGQQRIHRILVVKDNEDHVVNYNYRAALSPSCFNSVGKSVINSNPDTRYPLATFFHIETRASTSNTYHAAFIYIYLAYIEISLLFRVIPFEKVSILCIASSAKRISFSFLKKKDCSSECY